jgi:hypothetical protein
MHDLKTIQLKRIEMQAGCQWLTPVILATQEVEIRKIRIEVSPGK